ncbi:acyl-CoA thioesterase [Parasphingopyxis lamellibrachiae]|uniref:Acyl-CoA thioester hydrolase n=1 Tax=Parasphingopyxis lamellibrachiae TaxID=680125 RepID=A0A3D9FG08_9SPHN|nr:acyl-CoA thioesterase [Parasphingopyxis lamellibrachiae]RED16754.1 acyl-CoA thioester hydrolase [Parasphingopyxis lamellibrachiae]
MSFSHTVTARPEHIDELGHVNNAVWVQWIQDLAVAHWTAVAAPEHVAAYIWVVIRHEIDYLRPALEGDTVTGTTWIEEPPMGARFNRYMEFTGKDGKPCIRAKTTWAMIGRASGRPSRVTPEIAAPFLPDRG